MTFFDLQTCARCFTQKVGYEIGHNSSCMQQLPGKKKQAFRFSASLSNAIKSLDCREWRKSLMQFSKSSPSSLLGSWLRSEHTLRPNETCFSFARPGQDVSSIQDFSQNLMNFCSRKQGHEILIYKCHAMFYFRFIGWSPGDLNCFTDFSLIFGRSPWFRTVLGLEQQFPLNPVVNQNI